MFGINNTHFWLMMLLFIGVGTGYAAHFTQSDQLYFIGNHIGWVIAFLLLRKFSPFIRSPKTQIMVRILCLAGAYLSVAEILDEGVYDPLQVGWNDMVSLTIVFLRCLYEYRKYY